MKQQSTTILELESDIKQRLAYHSHFTHECDDDEPTASVTCSVASTTGDMSLTSRPKTSKYTSGHSYSYFGILEEEIEEEPDDDDYFYAYDHSIGVPTKPSIVSPSVTMKQPQRITKSVTKSSECGYSFFGVEVLEPKEEEEEEEDDAAYTFFGI